MKFTPSNSANISTGELHEATLDLADKQFSNKGSIDMAGFTKASIQIICIGATGTSGNAAIEQSNTKKGKSFPITGGPVTVALGPATDNAVFDVEVGGAFLHINFDGATLGSVGKIQVLVSIKR